MDETNEPEYPAWKWHAQNALGALISLIFFGGIAAGLIALVAGVEGLKASALYLISIPLSTLDSLTSGGRGGTPGSSADRWIIAGLMIAVVWIAGRLEKLSARLFLLEHGIRKEREGQERTAFLREHEARRAALSPALRQKYENFRAAGEAAQGDGE